MKVLSRFPDFVCLDTSGANQDSSNGSLFDHGPNALEIRQESSPRDAGNFFSDAAVFLCFSPPRDRIAA